MRYRDAGVDIDRGAELVERIRGAAESTRRPGWLDGLGGFGSLFRLDLTRWRRPVLVAGTDGVGTKLRVAQAMGRHDTIGIDLVAMCANDVLAQGAEPLFFLDYLAVGRLDPETAAGIVEGVAEGCRRAGCSLTGGETAEMPGFYPDGEYELAGFCVGVADEDRLVTGRGIRPGDPILGIPSSGPHSNGYSLIRAILGDDLRGALARPVPWGGTLGDALLAPTEIYVRGILPALATGGVRGLVHVTGGGITDNLPRVLPPGTAAVVTPGSWPVPPVFGLLQREGDVDDDEMRRVFNLGLGYLVVAEASRSAAVCAAIEGAGYAVHTVGRVVEGPGGVRYE